MNHALFLHELCTVLLAQQICGHFCAFAQLTFAALKSEVHCLHPARHVCHKWLDARIVANVVCLASIMSQLTCLLYADFASPAFILCN